MKTESCFLRSSNTEILKIKTSGNFFKLSFLPFINIVNEEDDFFVLCLLKETVLLPLQKLR